MDAESIVKLALNMGFTEAIAVTRLTRWRMLRFANNEPTVFNSWNDTSASVYLAKGRRVISLSLSTLSDDAVRARLNEALSQIDRVSEDPDYVPLTQHGPVKAWESYDPSVEGAEEKVVDMVKEAVDSSLSEGSVRNAGAFSYGVEEVHYSDSTGLEASWRGTFFNLSIRAFHSDPEISSMEASVGRRLSEIDPRRIGSRAGQLLKMASKLPKTNVEGRFSVVLGPLVVGHIYGLIANSWLNAYSVIRGLSPFSRDNLGSQAASSTLTMVDLSADPSKVGSEPMDLEGNQTTNLVLVERGVLRSFIHNNRTAARLGAKPTGNAARGWISPSIRHIYVGPGDLSDDVYSIFREVGKGVFIQNNWYTRFQNIREGLFSTVCRDVVLLIDGGEPRYVLKGVRVSDSFRTLLSNVRAASRGVFEVYWWDMDVPSTVPYLVVDNVNMTKSFDVAQQ